MIQLDDTIIQADMQDVLTVLKSELAAKGVERFRTFRLNGNNIQTNCPFHKNGQERRPSFGINIHNGQAHCFTCGWGGSLDEMISELMGYLDNGKHGRGWLVRRFNSLEVENRPTIQIKPREKIVTEYDIVPESVLDSYRYIHPYMYERGLTDEIIEEFDVGYDKENDCLTFPVKNLKGEVMLVATRSVKGKYFHIPQTEYKPVYCADRFVNGDYNICYVTESFLNCLTLWKLGLPAVALMGTGSHAQKVILKELPVRQYVLALDPDAAGQRATKSLKRFLGDTKMVSEIIYTNTEEDINDLQERFLELDKTF